MPNIAVHIDSRETIKPSYPTKNDDKSYRFCFMDQMMPPIYITVILFYDTSDDGKSLPRLKESLSETLTSFFPLAGRIKDNTSIDCNDEGILYAEAQADCSMHDFLKEPDIQLLNKLLPCKKNPTQPMTELPQVALQVTVFTCGGLSIAGCYNHKIMDGASIGCFLKKWAANLSGCHNGVVHPDLATASRTFPPGENITPFTPEFLPSPTTNMCILRRFVFDATALQVLLEKARSEQVPNPTRTEVVSAFIWKHTMTKTIKSNHGSGYPIGKSSFLTHFVNVRKHASLPKGSIGCLILTASAMVDLSSERDQELDRLVSRVHDAILSMDAEYVKTFQGEGALEAMWKNIEITLFDKEAQFMCSSWCKLGLDEVDFGWGKPIWVSPFGEPPSLMEKNSLILMDANGGKDIEAWLVMQEKQMVALEHDEEFLAFATPAVGVPMSTSC